MGHTFEFKEGFPGGSDSKESACNAGDPGLISGLGQSPGEGNGSFLQYSCLEYPMDRRAWWATVHGVTWSGHDWVTNILSWVSGSTMVAISKDWWVGQMKAQLLLLLSSLRVQSSCSHTLAWLPPLPLSGFSTPSLVSPGGTSLIWSWQILFWCLFLGVQSKVLSIYMFKGAFLLSPSVCRLLTRSLGCKLTKRISSEHPGMCRRQQHSELWAFVKNQTWNDDKPQSSKDKNKKWLFHFKKYS